MSDKPSGPLNSPGAAIHSAPLAYITINADFTLLSVNQKAESLGVHVGDSINDHLDEPSKTALLALTESSGSGMFEGSCSRKGTFEFYVSQMPDSTQTQLWLFDISELRLIQSQLQKQKKPERRFLHQMHNLVSTTLGYAELVGLMLEENTSLSGERLSAVRRYQNEIGTGLRQSENIILQEKRGAAPYSDVTSSSIQHVLVVHDEPTRVALLVELLQSQQYKVTSFSDLDSATKYSSMNAKSIDLAVLGSADKLVDYLLEANTQIQILVCSSEQVCFEDDRLHSIADTPLDINELVLTVQKIRSSQTRVKV